jgi:hypothetical protein
MDVIIWLAHRSSTQSLPSYMALSTNQVCTNQVCADGFNGAVVILLHLLDSKQISTTPNATCSHETAQAHTIASSLTVDSTDA